MNIIGIDPSISSTALIVNNKIFNYATRKNAFNKSGLSKWYKLIEDDVNYRFFDSFHFSNYQNEQVEKLNIYESIVDNIIDDIVNNIDLNDESIVGIEGYSYSSAFGPIVDLVTFGTLLRDRIKKNITTNIKYFAPKELKLKSCKLTYKPIEKIKGKKKKKVVYEHRNNDGLAGGNFTKKEMMMAITDNKNLNDDWTEFLHEYKDEIYEKKNIPAPINDINDAYLIYEILKANF